MLANSYDINNNSRDVFNAYLLSWDFVKSLDIEPTTKQGYNVCLRSFARYLDQEGIENPTKDTILEYKKMLSDGGYSAGTMQQYIRSLKQFFAWTEKRGFLR